MKTIARKYPYLKYLCLKSVTLSKYPKKIRPILDAIYSVFGEQINMILTIIEKQRNNEDLISYITRCINIASGGEYHLFNAQFKYGQIDEKELKKLRRKTQKTKDKIAFAIGDLFVWLHIIFEKFIRTYNYQVPTKQDKFWFALSTNIMQDIMQFNFHYYNLLQLNKVSIGQKKSVQSKNIKWAKFDSLIEKQGFKRPKSNNEIRHIREELKKHIPTQRKNKTIEDHILDYFNSKK